MSERYPDLASAVRDAFEAARRKLRERRKRIFDRKLGSDDVMRHKKTTGEGVMLCAPPRHFRPRTGSVVEAKFVRKNRA